MSPKKIDKLSVKKYGLAAPKNAQQAKQQIKSLLRKNAEAMKALASPNT